MGKLGLTEALIAIAVVALLFAEYFLGKVKGRKPALASARLATADGASVESDAAINPAATDTAAVGSAAVVEESSAAKVLEADLEIPPVASKDAAEPAARE